MRGDVAGSRWGPGLVAAGVIVGAMALGACGGGGAAPSGAKTSAGTAAGALGTPSFSLPASEPQGFIARSKLVGVTKLTKAQLCGVLTGGEAARILGSPTAAPVYASTFGLGITCIWVRRGGSDTGSDELYVGISTVFDWQGAQAIDRLMRTHQTTIDGHPTLAADPHGAADYALVHVALGGAHDPAVEFRAPTVAMATQLARIVTPRLLTLGGV